MVFGLCAVVIVPCPVGSTTSLKILGLVLALRSFQEAAFLLQQAPNTHLWFVPEPLVAARHLCSFRSSIFGLSCCCAAQSSAQEMQGLPIIIQRFPLVESFLCLYGHFSILALTLSLVSELSVPRSSVNLHSLWWMPPTLSIVSLNK